MISLDSAEKLERGVKAKALLDNEFFQDCFARLDGYYVEAWRNAQTVEKREDAHKFVRLIEWLKYDLNEVAQTGAIEEKRLAELEARNPPMKLAEFRR